MLFNSWQFLIFFPLVTGLYFAAPSRHRWWVLLLASCVFYMAFVPAYILILAATIAVDYVAGLMIARSVGHRRKLWLIASLAANLGALAFFKYFNFVNDNVRHLAALIHWHYPVEALAIVLPIGLSFHIFQSLSYTIEVYRGNQAPERHLGIFALYVMFYPQLVAGPIERPQNLLHQFHAPKPFDPDQFKAGLQRMLWGLFKKVVIADRLAAMVNPVFAYPHHHTGLTLAAATAMFAVQIYCDFSGYSDIALGAAQTMGYRLMENFDRPYHARSVREFWTRWHISLSTWFKDYLYIPLGGNRVPKWRWSLNLLIVFMASGLWHGAHWTFVIWGALHGAYLVGSIWTAPLRRRLAGWTGLDRHPRVLAAWQLGVTFTLVSVAWIFFRANSLSDAWYIASHLLSGATAQVASVEAFQAALKPFGHPAQLCIALLAIASLEGVHQLQRRGSVRARLGRFPLWVRWPAYQLLIVLIIAFGVYDNQAFIYFQF